MSMKEMRKRYYWKGMDLDVSKWYKACQHCNSHKVKQNTIHKAPMTSITSNEPWETVGVDVVPFTMPNGEKKNVLLAIDYFSKN